MTPELRLRCVALVEAIYEPKRGDVTTGGLGVVPNVHDDPRVGQGNIQRVLDSATPEERSFWRAWYTHAHQDVQGLSQRFQVPFELVAAVVAVLSPGNKWNANLTAAERILTDWTQGEDVGLQHAFGFGEPEEIRRKINAYGANVEKAKRMLKSAQTNAVSGPKVSVFFRSLVDPEKAKREMAVTLDGHAINVWRGVKRPLKGMASPSDDLAEQMRQDYRIVAGQNSLAPMELQAITWYVWKYTVDRPPTAQLALAI